ncbi:hypothetical protein [Kamptonema sp. UHCC 0994]|uniref:hypothetical protein n=1 Tax=Kamptonema sp. UHCC 0994 TaxID=3031329 RepID=UPI0023B8B3AE|nr:hypothetical protein [Kamptonema sp. UHCC 0994]
MVGGSMPYYLKKLLCGVALGAALLGCSSPATIQSGNWQTYRNARYNFEFLYPDNWVAAEAPANGDGQVFSDPKNPVVEIRGWAGYNLAAATGKQRDKNNSIDRPKPLQRNFTTEQGLSGELKVDLGSQVSSMTLTLVTGDVRYNFQGKAPSKQFADYYKFFYYVASQYRVSPQPK